MIRGLPRTNNFPRSLGSLMASSENIEKTKKEQETVMFQGKNIHSSPVDGKPLCSFSEKTCMQRRLNRYAFCIRHVLEDKTAPFKQCKFVAKYNGQRCTNAIPVREERIYCNSHLQVLGIVPKKRRKKKIHEPSEQTTKNIAKSSQAEILPSRTLHQNAVLTKRTEKTRSSCAGPSKHSPDERASKKAKILSSNPLLWQLVSTYSQATSHRRDLLPYYGFCSSDEESLHEEDSDDECKVEMTAAVSDSERRNCESLKCSPRTAKLRQLRERLRAELIGVKKSISAHNKDVKQSSKALGLLMTSVKANPALTAVVIQNENTTFLTSSRKRSAPTKPKPIQCTAKSSEKIKCDRNAIPYTKYCSHHIVNDSKQLLFHKCVADVSANSKCSLPTLDLLYEKPLCRDHAPGKATYHPVLAPIQTPKPVDALPAQKPLAKKPRRKPQVRASPTQKPVKASKKATKKEPQKTSKSEKNKRPVNAVPVAVKIKQEILLDHSMNHLNFDKSGFLSPNLVSERHLSVDYIPNGNIKLEQLPSPKNDMNVFGNDEFKTPGMFDAHEMDVDEGLENEDLNMPEDLGDISPTGMLRDSVLKLPLEMSEPRVKLRLKEERKSPTESYSMGPVSEANLHKPMALSNRVEKLRKGSLCTNNKQYEVQALVNHMNIMPGVRPSRSSVITLPKYPSNSTSLVSGLPRHSMPVCGAEFSSFTPIGPGIIKSEGGTRKVEHRGLDVHHGQAMFPLSFDAVLNSTVAWGAGGKLLLNNRARPLLLNSQMNNVTFSPPSISPHVSPQITLGTAFNFDRPSVLQHSNSPSPTLSPFSANLPNSPHGKLAPRTPRLEGRGNPNAGDMDPFFGGPFDKP